MEIWQLSPAAIFAEAALTSALESVARLLLAILAGAILGWEREWMQKPAGLRTHMMVALGAAAFVLAALEFSKESGLEGSPVQLDPIRVIHGVIGGVGFLGAGAIIESRGAVRGITTAASIWVAASIGVACGLGLYTIAFSSVTLAVLVLAAAGFAEHRLFRDKDKNKPSEPD